MSKNMCAGTVVEPPGVTSAAIVSMTSISRSVAFNESLERSPCKSTLARIGMVLRRSTTRWTWPKDFNNSERSTVTFIAQSEKEAKTRTTRVARREAFGKPDPAAARGFSMSFYEFAGFWGLLDGKQSVLDQCWFSPAAGV